MVEAGHPDNRKIRAEFNLEFMKFDGCNIQEPTREKLETLTLPPVGNHSFAVKTHFPPNQYVLELLSTGKIKATYIYRDPRDIVISGLDAGRKLRERGIFDRFGKLNTMKEAIDWCYGMVRDNWQRWSNVQGVLYFRYENLVKDTLGELLRLSDYLEIKVKKGAIKKIIDKYDAENLRKSIKEINKYHFNVGKAGRFREVMTGEELESCNEIFGDYIEKMGYSK